MPAGEVVPVARKRARCPGLPAEVSSLVGRGPQVAAVLDRLRMAQVVTLVGPGGCGKTRVALRVAALAEGGFADGARLVELASLADPTLVPGYVAQALEIPERGGRGPTENIMHSLAVRDMLIVLDNCEHVRAQAAGLVAQLTGQCPQVRVVTTSRERLDVPGEFVFPVPPLGLPEDGSAGAVARSEAGRLFIERARAADPAFELTDGNAAAIAEVCARLDGMPLAIELAAARCPALGLAQLAARLHGHPGLLSGGPGRPDRHRTLEALVAWSYDLLDEAERRLLARLSVLRGSFDLELAEHVAGSEPLAPAHVAGLLASLAGKSVVQVQASHGVRYSLLETIRQFAAERLASLGEEAAAHARLLGWAVELAREAEATVASAGWPAWSGRLAEVTLSDPQAAAGLSQAPVTVAITTGSVSHALVVPVDALLAQPGGGYAVEVTGRGGTRHLVAVSPGLFDDAAGLVQVTGTGLAAGQRVVVPAI